PPHFISALGDAEVDCTTADSSEGIWKIVEAGENDLAGAALLFESGRSARANLGGDAKNGFEIRMRLEESFGFVDGHVDFALFIFAGDDFEIRRFFFKATLEALETVIEIGCTEATLEDGDFAFGSGNFDE